MVSFQNKNLIRSKVQAWNNFPFNVKWETTHRVSLIRGFHCWQRSHCCLQEQIKTLQSDQTGNCDLIPTPRAVISQDPAPERQEEHGQVPEGHMRLWTNHEGEPQASSWRSQCQWRELDSCWSLINIFFSNFIRLYHGILWRLLPQFSTQVINVLWAKWKR